jgi:hypothetical protein
VNPGSDPDRDDFGLPPVDIEIPDDARELDRDVQAYQRELRALRRRQRASRLRGPLTRDGMVLPLLAGCLILALVTSTLLIMFAADQTGMPELPGHTTTQSAPPKHPASSPPAAAGKIGGPLPSGQITVAGKSVPLSAVTASVAAVLTLIPQNCRCASTLRQLGTRAAQAHVAVYLVGTAGVMQQLAQLAAQAGQHSAQVAEDKVAEDKADVLGTTYRHSGVTAILVRSDGLVASVVSSLTQPARLQQAEAGLRQIGAAKLAGG